MNPDIEKQAIEILPASLPSVEILETTGRDDLAVVHLLQLGSDRRRCVETVDSVDPRFSRQDKTVIIVSTQLGCRMGCLMCDAPEAGFAGQLTAGEILAQVRFVVERRPEILRARKLKVHFARMGEPADNPEAVQGALLHLPALLPCPGLMPCIATMAPRGSEPFFEALKPLKDQCYGDGHFQLQISVNATDPAMRRRLMPHPHLSLDEIAAVGQRFFRPGDRKVALNLALCRGVTLDPEALYARFDPACFMIKLTPVNPTRRALRHGLQTLLSAETPDAAEALVARLRDLGFDCVVSIGEPEEIRIGSNCGQLVLRAARQD